MYAAVLTISKNMVQFACTFQEAEPHRKGTMLLCLYMLGHNLHLSLYCYMESEQSCHVACCYQWEGKGGREGGRVREGGREDKRGREGGRIIRTPE